MADFLPVFFRVLFCTVIPLLLCGLALWLCRSLYVMLCGEQSGRRLILAASILSVPLRETAHAVACLAFFHRVEELRLFNHRDPSGELGFVEHSYNPRNPIALLGNFVYALMPVVLCLAVTAVVCLSCFPGVLELFFEQISALNESGAGFGAYVESVRSLIPALFEAAREHALLGFVGVALLLLICFGAYVTPVDLRDAFSGALIFAGLCAAISFIVVLLDSRIARIVRGGLSAFATAVTALFLVLLLAAVAWLLVGAIFFLVRGLLGLDMVRDEE